MTNSPPFFVGRETQLEQLNSHWREAYHKQQGKVVFLVGEAGIGKTSLVEQFSRSVLKNYSGVQYAYAQCDQVAGDISPYAPFVQILNSLTEQAAKRGDNWFVEYMREVGPDVLGMVPVAGSLLTAAAKSVDFVWQWRKKDRPGDADRGQFGQQDLFQQFTDTFRNIAANQNPLLLCIDDWHWADTSSTNLLFHLARQLNDVPLLLLATYRPHDAEAREHPILHVRTEMERYSLCASLGLDFLSRAEVESYLAQRFPEAEFAPDFVDWLLQTTSGNALFTSEYLNLLLNEGLLTMEGQLTGELADLQPPANVEAVIRTRLGYVDREARDMLAYGSVEGEQFTTLVLSRLLDIKPLSLIRKLRAIEETHHLIASLGQQGFYEQQTTVYRFVHALIYRTLYNMLEEEERVEISRLLFELLEELFDAADDQVKPQILPELVTQAGISHNVLKQAEYASKAADSVALSYGHAETIRYCNIGLQALKELSPQNTYSLKIDLLTRLATTQDFIGHWQSALKNYRLAIEIAQTNRAFAKLVRVLNKAGWVLQTIGQDDEAIALHLEALEYLKQSDDSLNLARTLTYLGAIQYKTQRFDEALNTFQHALTLWQKLDMKRGISSAHNWIAKIYCIQQKYDLANITLDCTLKTT